MLYDYLDLILKICILVALQIFIFFIARYYKIFKEKNINDKKERTLKLCLEDKTNYENIIFYTQDIDLKDKYFHDDRVVDVIIEKINFFEKLALGIRMKIYDEEIISYFYLKIILVFHERFKLLIYRYRDSLKQPYLYIEFEKLVQRWEKYNNENKGGVLFE